MSKQNWFSKWVVNNRLVSGLVVVFMILLVLFMFDQVKFIFVPVGAFFAVVGAPLLTAGIFYYLLNPLVELMERRLKMSKSVAVSVLFVILGALLVWGTIALAPIIKDSTISFLKSWPEYYRAWSAKITTWAQEPFLKPLKTWVLSFSSDLNEMMVNLTKNYLQTGILSLGRAAKFLALVGLTLITFPFILFYMLKDSAKFPQYILRFVPTKSRKSTEEILGEINQQVSDYVRGQILTGVVVSIMFIIGFSIIGLPYGIWIGLMAGPLNLIPYLGSFLAMVPAIIIGLIQSPQMLLYVLIVFVIEQTLESRVFHPMILADSLTIHPVTVLLVLLGAGEMFGLLGVAVGIPAYSVIKIFVSHIYSWWTQNSSLYTND